MGKNENEVNFNEKSFKLKDTTSHSLNVVWPCVYFFTQIKGFLKYLAHSHARNTKT